MATIGTATIRGRTSVAHGARLIAQSSRRGLAPRHRRISHTAGRGLEILGHAIEYLADEHIYAGGQFNLSDPRVQAVTLLMELNREIYYACPEVPTLGERFRALLGFRAHGRQGH